MIEGIRFQMDSDLLTPKGKSDRKVEAERPEILNAQWVPAAKVGQVVDIESALCSVTAESLAGSIGTWKGGKIYKNHETEIKNHIILDEKFENPFLSFLLDAEIVAALADGGGGSIDAIATLVEEGRIRTINGVGYSVLDKDKTPACTKDAGCGIAGEAAAEENGNVNIGSGIINQNIKVDEIGDGKNSDPNKVDKDKERDKKNMADKSEKSEVVFTEAQVATIKGEAARDVTERLTAQHKVEMTDLATAHQTELDALDTTHIGDLETQRAEVQKHVEMVESLKTKFGLSDEAGKGLMDAKTPEDVYTLLATLKVEKAEPVIAAEGSAAGCGIILGSQVEATAPITIKVEEVGSYNPYTGKYEPTYREELK